METESHSLFGLLHRSIRLTLPIALLAFCAVPTSAQLAGGARVFTYQGSLLNNGAPATGTHKVVCSIYDSTSKIWSETQTVLVSNGIFSVELGKTVALPPTNLTHIYSLGVSVDGGAELSPRTEITSAPFAMHAAIADALSSSAGGGVTSLNHLSGAITLVGAGGATVTPKGDTISISSGGSGGTGILGVQSTDGSIAITNPNGPTANVTLPAGGISISKLSTSGALNGQVLTFESGQLQYSNPQGFALPYAGTNTSSSDAFSITSTGDVQSGYFLSTASSTSKSALVGESQGTGSSGFVAGVSGIGHNFGVIGTGGSGYSGMFGIVSTRTPSYHAGAGVAGYSDQGPGTYGFTADSSDAGVEGGSSYGIGVLASSTNGIGAKVTTTSASNPNPALLVQSAGIAPGIDATSAGGPGIKTGYSGVGVGVALEVASGAIKVSGPLPTAFVQTANPANIVGNYTVISNPLTDGDPFAMLTVTPVLGPTGVYCNFPIGVTYISATGKWAIFNQNGPLSLMPLNASFNVLVIKH